jgi:glycerol-3-phosphate acyltransferase PlsY
MMSLELLVCLGAVCAYLLGSIPTAVWVGKKFYNIDVREHGSGNAGTTNVLRVLGGRAAIPVLIIDVLKGFAAVTFIHLFSNSITPQAAGLIKITYGMLAVVGHMYPIFAGFRGGKGVATMLGIAIAIQPMAVLVAVLVFGVMFAVTRVVSISSMSAGLAFALSVVLICHEPLLSIRIFSVAVAVLLIYTHRRNIRRLLNGTEPQILFKKKS